jgi:hypothetical protein
VCGSARLVEHSHELGDLTRRNLALTHRPIESRSTTEKERR